MTHMSMHDLDEFKSRPLGVDFEALSARNKIEARVTTVRGGLVSRVSYLPRHERCESEFRGIACELRRHHFGHHQRRVDLESPRDTRWGGTIVSVS